MRSPSEFASQVRDHVAGLASLGIEERDRLGPPMATEKYVLLRSALNQLGWLLVHILNTLDAYEDQLSEQED